MCFQEGFYSVEGVLFVLVVFDCLFFQGAGGLQGWEDIEGLVVFGEHMLLQVLPHPVA